MRSSIIELSDEFWTNDLIRVEAAMDQPLCSSNKTSGLVSELRPDDPMTLWFLKPNTILAYCFVHSIDTEERRVGKECLL